MSDSDSIRRQILESISDPVVPIEKRIALSFLEYNEYCAYINSYDLGIILKKVLYTLVAEQKVAGFDVPILHNVSEMSIRIDKGAVYVKSEVHVRAPVTAFIRFKYILENVEDAPRLRLMKNTLKVEEVTKPFDIAAKLALKVMDVESIARYELSDPGAVILRTLPDQLRPHGFDGKITTIELELMDDNTLSVFMKAERAS
ncbi:MAG: hypothetical protein U0694_15615 [Anaerolineae bacterium]